MFEPIVKVPQRYAKSGSFGSIECDIYYRLIMECKIQRHSRSKVHIEISVMGQICQELPIFRARDHTRPVAGDNVLPQRLSIQQLRIFLADSVVTSSIIDWRWS